MEWVETTGRSVQEAKDAALDELGVDEADAEFEVLAEAQTGLFGRLRSEARVRARVRPTAPRAKEDRRSRDKRRRAGGQGRDGSESTAGAAPAADSATAAAAGGGAAGGASGTGPSRPPAKAEPTRSGDAQSGALAARATPDSAAANGADEDGAGIDVEASNGLTGGEVDGGPSSGANRRRRNRRRGGNRPGAAPSGQQRASAEEAEYDDDRPEKGSEVEVDLDRQAEVAADFLTKLTAEFGLEAKVAVTRPDEDTVEVQLSGSDLGILIGPKGATLVAIQNLTRTVVFNETGGNNGHINVDVGGYRQKRTEALVRFSRQVAEQVKSSGNRTVLEPMSAVDRKIVHDTISDIDGVSTISEGEEPRRRVVVLPG